MFFSEEILLERETLTVEISVKLLDRIAMW